MVCRQDRLRRLCRRTAGVHRRARRPEACRSLALISTVFDGSATDAAGIRYRAENARTVVIEGELAKELERERNALVARVAGAPHQKHFDYQTLAKQADVG
ncbi:MAG: hypothetical protein IT481_03260 [Gammaproteobacteria bacterium]|nr:hypothetical protein [Gammaproteobacteria bacterium]